MPKLTRYIILRRPTYNLLQNALSRNEKDWWYFTSKSCYLLYPHSVFRLKAKLWANREASAKL